MQRGGADPRRKQGQQKGTATIVVKRQPTLSQSKVKQSAVWCARPTLIADQSPRAPSASPQQHALPLRYGQRLRALWWLQVAQDGAHLSAVACGDWMDGWGRGIGVAFVPLLARTAHTATYTTAHLCHRSSQLCSHQVHLCAAERRVRLRPRRERVVLRCVRRRRALQLREAQLAAQAQQRRSLCCSRLGVQL